MRNCGETKTVVCRCSCRYTHGRNFVVKCGGTHKRRQGGQRGHGPPKFLENIVIVCFESRFSKQNSVIRLKSNILATPKFLGWLRHRGAAWCETNVVIGSMQKLFYIHSFPILFLEVF